MRSAMTLALGRLDVDLIHVAPHPVLSRLERLHDRVSLSVEMLRGMRVWRRVATADVTAAHAEPQVNPSVAGLQAFLATVRGTRLHISNLVEMRALGFGHGRLLSV